jgi:hypothetical protein
MCCHECKGRSFLYHCIIDVMSWLIGSTKWMKLKWSPYGEIPHGKTFCEVQMVKWLGQPIFVVW